MARDNKPHVGAARVCSSSRALAFASFRQGQVNTEDFPQSITPTELVFYYLRLKSDICSSERWLCAQPHAVGRGSPGHFGAVSLVLI